MRRVSIYCDNPIHYLAFSYILKNKISITFTDRIHGKSDFTTTDCILFVLSEGDLFECLDLYYKKIIYRD